MPHAHIVIDHGGMRMVLDLDDFELSTRRDSIEDDYQPGPATRLHLGDVTHFSIKADLDEAHRPRWEQVADLNSANPTA